MANTFDWVEIRVRDIEKTANFYKSLFGWEILQREATAGSDYWIFDTGGEPRTQNIRRGGLWLRPEGEDLGVIVYILVDDIEGVLRKVVELGGKAVSPKTPQGPAFRACFADPSGNVFGLWEERDGD